MNILNTQRAFSIRALEQSDLAEIKQVIDANELFPSEMLDGMASAYFDQSAEGDFWLTVEDGQPIAVAYYVPERMTQGTWNVLLIAVHPDRHGQGIGAALMARIEADLAERGERVLLVETSSLPAFERTRAFYRKLGYDQEATIREFYQAGEDKVIFRKALSLVKPTGQVGGREQALDAPRPAG